MKKTIRLTESELKNMIAESVSKTLNEMGTPKQNAFLQRLMGNRYKPEYDNLPVNKASELIDAELQRQNDERNSGKASPKQIDFIENNKYYSIPSIRTIADSLTKQDANALVSALNPYTNGKYTYYGHARQKKEQWLPQMKEAVVPILEKYGLSQEAQDVVSYVDNFMEKFNAKAEKKAAKEKEERLNRIMNADNTLFFVSTQDEENVKQHECERLSHELFMDGILESKMHWDIPYLVTDMTKYSMDTIKDYVEQYGVVTFPSIVIGYDGICSCVLWKGFDFAYRPSICGRLVDESESRKAYQFGKENLGKANGERLQENKLRKIIKESIKRVLRESKGFDPNMPVIIVGGDLEGHYTAQEIVDNFDINGYEEQSENPIYADSPIVGYPRIKGYVGPMWDGDKIRYESQDAYDFFSI